MSREWWSHNSFLTASKVNTQQLLSIFFSLIKAHGAVFFFSQWEMVGKLVGNFECIPLAQPLFPTKKYVFPPFPTNLQKWWGKKLYFLVGNRKKNWRWWEAEKKFPSGEKKHWHGAVATHGSDSLYFTTVFSFSRWEMVGKLVGNFECIPLAQPLFPTKKYVFPPLPANLQKWWENKNYIF